LTQICLFLKIVIWDFEIWQNGHKIQNGVQNLHFLNFALETLFYNRFQKPWMYSKRLFIIFFSKIQNRGIIFEKKSTFFKRVLPTLNSTFFKSSKSNLVGQRHKIYKNNSKEIIKMADIFKMAFVIFSHMNRYFEYIELVLGLSQYRLTFNYKK
jgi:hypothetical protein